MTKFQFNSFLLTKLPIAFLAGLKLNSLTKNEAKISVKLGFFNQNPFKSMFWAVQGMAAELSTGLLCISSIQKSKSKISMLVIEQRAVFTKKAVGEIIFTCNQGDEIQRIIKETIDTNQPKTIELNSKGIDSSGNQVAEFNFLWSFKTKI